jgi:hypothetical protein
MDKDDLLSAEQLDREDLFLTYQVEGATRRHTPAELQAIGMVAVKAGKLEYLTGMMVGAISGVSPEMTGATTKEMSFAQMIKMCRRMAQVRIDSEPESERWLGAIEWLTDMDSVLQRRNHILHSAWIGTPDRMEPLIRRGNLDWYKDSRSVLDTVLELDHLLSRLTTWIDFHRD